LVNYILEFTTNLAKGSAQMFLPPFSKKLIDGMTTVCIYLFRTIHFLG